MANKIIYFTTKSGDSPVQKFIASLSFTQKKKIYHILKYIETYGLESVIPHLKKLQSLPLWEIRILGKDNLRIFYVLLIQNRVLLMHGFSKKTQQTPQKEIQLALKHLADWQLRNPT